MNKKDTYNHIMESVSKIVKDAINEAAPITLDDKKKVFVKQLKKAINDKKFDRYGKKRVVISINGYDLAYDMQSEMKDFNKYFQSEDDVLILAASCRWCNDVQLSGYNLKVEYGSIFGGSIYSSKKCVEEIQYVSKPVKEFDKLNALLFKYAGKKLLDTQIYNARVAGKRNSIFERQPNYLMHDSEECNNIIEWIKANKKPSLKLSFKDERLLSRDEHTYRMECEWDGVESNYLVIQLTKSTGEVIALRSFYKTGMEYFY